MATATLDRPRNKPSDPSLENIDQLLQRLGGIPAERVKLWPPPGTATMQDLEDYNEGDRNGPVCELVDNTLVEKTVGAKESQAAIKLGARLEFWNETANLGAILGADGTVKLTPEQGRAPDVAFYLKSRFPGGKLPPGKIPLMWPDLAVEILSESNTKAEMRRKRREYFAAGTRLVWEFDLETRSVVVYREPMQGVTLSIDDVLDGEDVLPGFKLVLRPWFESILSLYQ